MKDPVLEELQRLTALAKKRRNRARARRWAPRIQKLVRAAFWTVAAGVIFVGPFLLASWLEHMLFGPTP